MGRITTKVQITNFADEIRAENGLINQEEVRILTIKEALVDTGAIMLSAPIDLIEKLGLKEEGIRQVRTANRTVDRRIYQVVRISLEGREGLFQVMELPIKMPVLIGQIVLEQLDLYPDPQHIYVFSSPFLVSDENKID